MLRLLRWSEFTTRRFFLRLDDRDPIERKALESPLLIETTPARQGRVGQFCEAFVRHRALIGVTQEADGTGLIDHQEVFDRVAFLLAAVVGLLFLGIGRAMDRALGTSMPTMGDVGATLVRSDASSTANSSAVRAGSSSGCAKA